MSDYSVAGGVGSFEYRRRDSARFDAALEAVEEAVACYARLRNRAVVSGNAAEADRLLAGQAACLTQQQQLRPDDTATVDRILAEYPALIAWLRDRIG
ncbi:hypothetical protein ACPPVO_56265 [Dactylosporangium sp. McL0621]|uniref:hypothetical protein n=1 Tax=Dactylosporangium sp. McL0621 TaxID=3415678 RepID=UPI003CF3A32A